MTKFSFLFEVSLIHNQSQAWLDTGADVLENLQSVQRFWKLLDLYTTLEAPSKVISRRQIRPKLRLLTKIMGTVSGSLASQKHGAEVEAEGKGPKQPRLYPFW